MNAVAATLKAAHFGAVVWSGSVIDGLTVEALQGLVTDLNQVTRFTGVPIGARGGASGVVQVSGWMTGFPPRTGFGRGYPEHDPWRFDAKRLVDSGEADAALWISAHRGEAPGWTRVDLPLITLAPKGAGAKHGLYIEVGRPGETHDAVELAQESSSFVLRRAKNARKGADRRRGYRRDRREIFGGCAVLTCLSGGHVVDPVNGTDGVGDVYFEDGRIVARPDGRKPDVTHDVSGHTVMAGAIDIHSHIAAAT